MAVSKWQFAKVLRKRKDEKYVRLLKAWKAQYLSYLLILIYCWFLLPSLFLSLSRSCPPPSLSLSLSLKHTHSPAAVMNFLSQFYDIIDGPGESVVKLKRTKGNCKFLFQKLALNTWRMPSLMSVLK